MSKVVTTTVLPDVVGGTVTLGGTGDSVVVTGNDIRTNALQDAGGNAVFTSDGSGTLSGMNSGLSGSLKLIQSQTASSSASISFTTGIDSTYDVYKFTFVDINPSTDAYLTINFSSDGGSNYNMDKTTTFFEAYHYESGASGLIYQGGYDLAQSAGGQPLSQHTGGTDTDNCMVGELCLFAPSSTTYIKHFYGTSNNLASAAISQNGYVGGYVNSTSAVNAVQFKLNTGTFDGTIKLYGISKS
jgi:hypothetical protein